MDKNLQIELLEELVKNDDNINVKKVIKILKIFHDYYTNKLNANTEYLEEEDLDVTNEPTIEFEANIIPNATKNPDVASEYKWICGNCKQVFKTSHTSNTGLTIKCQSISRGIGYYDKAQYRKGDELIPIAVPKNKDTKSKSKAKAGKKK